MRAACTTWLCPRMTTELPLLKRCLGKSVTMRHLSSPRMPWAPRTCATTRKSGRLRSEDGLCGSVPVPAPTESEALNDVEVDSGAFARSGGFDEGAEASDDSALTADDFADVLFVDFELVDRRVPILDLVDLDR